jgi:hypothetical protein
MLVCPVFCIAMNRIRMQCLLFAVSPAVITVHYDSKMYCNLINLQYRTAEWKVCACIQGVYFT